MAALLRAESELREPAVTKIKTSIITNHMLLKHTTSKQQTAGACRELPGAFRQARNEGNGRCS